MNILPHYLQLYQQILKSLQTHSNLFSPQKQKAGRKPKLTDEQIAAIFILSYITSMKVLTFAKLLIDNSIQSYHIFRKSRLKRVYTLLRNYHIQKLIWILILKLIIGKKVKLIVDGTILEVAKVMLGKEEEENMECA